MAVRGNQPLISRRNLLGSATSIGIGTVALSLSGCARSGNSTVPDASDARHTLVAAFPKSEPYAAAEVPSRLPYMVANADGIPLTALTGPATFTVKMDGRAVGEDLVVKPRSEGIPNAYLPLDFNFPAPDVYDVEAIYEGERLRSQLQVFDVKQIGPPLVGQQLPPAPTPTAAASFDVDPICTRVPRCPFHAVNLADVVGTGKPIVVLVTTPAYCPTDVCGPMLDNLMAVVGDRNDMIVIHSEVYQNPKLDTDLSTATLAPLPRDYDLSFEPVLFVTNAEGVITARADMIVDRSEMVQLIG